MLKKNFKVEFIRIIACLSVLCYHIRRLPFKIDGSLSETAVFFECICTICVMTFFLISGFFIYNKNNNIISDWLSLIKNFFKNIFPPFFIAVIVSIVFHDYFISKKTIVECIQLFNTKDLFNSLFVSFRHLDVNNLPGTCGHLWYVYAYFFIILYYPITRLFLKKIPKPATYFILAILFLIMIINDYLLFYDNPILNFVFEIIKKPVIYSAFGCVLYNDFLNSKYNKNKIFVSILFLIIYIITFILLFKTQIKYYLSVNGQYVYTSWLSTFSLVLTISFVVIIYNFDLDKFVSNKFKSYIFNAASKSYLIYIIHYFIITKLMTLGFQGIFFNNLNNFFEHILYHIFYSIFIFSLSYLFVLLIEKIYYVIDKFCRRIIWQKEKTI